MHLKSLPHIQTTEIFNPLSFDFCTGLISHTPSTLNNDPEYPESFLNLSTSGSTQYPADEGWDTEAGEAVVRQYSKGILVTGGEYAESLIKVKRKPSGKIDGLAYWYAMHGVGQKLTRSDEISNDDHTGSSTGLYNGSYHEETCSYFGNADLLITTIGSDTASNQACFLSEGKQSITDQHEVTIDCVYKRGTFWLDAL